MLLQRLPGSTKDNGQGEAKDRSSFSRHPGPVRAKGGNHAGVGKKVPRGDEGARVRVKPFWGRVRKRIWQTASSQSFLVVFQEKKSTARNGGFLEMEKVHFQKNIKQSDDPRRTERYKSLEEGGGGGSTSTLSTS